MELFHLRVAPLNLRACSDGQMEVTQIVYRSRPNQDAIGTSRLAAFREIHATAQTANTRNGVTGVLAFTKEHFVQILEGERAGQQHV